MEKKITIPKAAEAAGMTRLTFSDDFDSYDTIDMSGEGKPGYLWYADRPYGGSTLTADEVIVKDSVLVLKPKMCAAAIGLPTYSRKGQTGFTYRFGYAEARMRFSTAHRETVKDGQIPAFWGISVLDVSGRPWDRVGELDILEAVQAHQADNAVIYTGTMHDHFKTPDGRRLCSNSVNATGYRDQFDFLDDDWHTYAALWEPGHVAWYLDGKEMHSARYSVDALPEYYYRDDPNPLPRLEDTMPTYKNLPWPGAHTIMDRDDMVLFLGGHVDWPVEVDWVHVWQK